jgi:hypothetical protein
MMSEHDVRMFGDENKEINSNHEKVIIIMLEHNVGT